MPILWTPADAIGVYCSGSKNSKFSNQNRTSNAKRAVFKEDNGSTTSGTITSAYYPYSSENADLPETDLIGKVPSVVDVNEMSGVIRGDYKYAIPYQGGFSTTNMKFAHMFSLINLNVDASGVEKLNGDKLLSVTFEMPDVITGDFTFNAKDGSYKPSSTASKLLTVEWASMPAIEGSNSTAVTMFPVACNQQYMNVTVTTDKHIATFRVKMLTNLEKGILYNFSFELVKYDDGTHNWNVVDRPQNSSSVGSFTCATYNVDGLPNLNLVFKQLNPDGPQADGTVLIGQRIKEQNWDFFAVSEDFEHHAKLVEGLGEGFSCGTWRGSITSANSSKAKRADTDGLNLFWKSTNGISASNEAWTQFTHEAGDLLNGANECIAKGWRYYTVTLKDGTMIDVVITHMNTYQGDDASESNNTWVAANEQLTEIANYIKSIYAVNKRPIIFMGDTNCRYTRHLIKTNLIDAIYGVTELTINDPWIDFMWDGQYPVKGLSYMVSDAEGTDPKYDIIMGNDQLGEVVDKIFYINNSLSGTTIKAKNYLRDRQGFLNAGKPLADHAPIVVEFSYEVKK